MQLPRFQKRRKSGLFAHDEPASQLSNYLGFSYTIREVAQIGGRGTAWSFAKGDWMFTLEIAGQPVAVTDAGKQRAEDFFTSDLFRGSLRELQSAGEALWDGSSVLNVRPASAVEAAAFRVALADSDEDDEALDGAEAFSVVYLVEVEDWGSEAG